MLIEFHSIHLQINKNTKHLHWYSNGYKSHTNTNPTNICIKEFYQSPMCCVLCKNFGFLYSSESFPVPDSVSGSVSVYVCVCACVCIFVLLRMQIPCNVFAYIIHKNQFKTTIRIMFEDRKHQQMPRPNPNRVQQKRQRQIKMFQNSLTWYFSHVMRFHHRTQISHHRIPVHRQWIHAAAEVIMIFQVAAVQWAPCVTWHRRKVQTRWTAAATVAAEILRPSMAPI